MKNLYILFFILASCVSKSDKIGDIFLHSDNIKNEDQKFVGEIYYKDNKLIFIESKNNKVDEVKERIEMIKYQLKQINKDGYIETFSISQPLLSPDGKMVDAENHYFKAIYLNDKGFWRTLSEEMLRNYHVEIRFSAAQNIN